MWNLHTFDWSGECPVCHLVHTHETARCPNDGSPLVVAFRCGRWNPFRYPMHTAHLRCTNNCGFTSNATECTRDGTVITGPFIRFRAPFKRFLIYNVRWIAGILLFLALVVLFPYVIWSGVTHGEEGGYSGATLGLTFFGFCAGLRFLWEMPHTWRWKCLRIIDFERATRR